MTISLNMGVCVVSRDIVSSTVKELADISPAVDVKQERMPRLGWRRTSIVNVNEGTYVAKEFVVEVASYSPKMPQPWHIEHRMLALLRTKGFVVPDSYGYRIDCRADKMHVTYVRACLPGTNIEEQVDDALLTDIAQCLARLHVQGVVTNDPQRGNFIRLSDQRLSMIDFGKASYFKRKGVGFYYQITRELFKVYRGVLDNKKDAWQSFIYKYHQTVNPSILQRGFESGLFFVFRARRRLRNWHRKRPNNA